MNNGTQCGKNNMNITIIYTRGFKRNESQLGSKT